MRPHKPYNKKYISIVLALSGLIVSFYVLAMLNMAGIYWLFGGVLLLLFAFLIYFVLLVHHLYLYSKPVIFSLTRSAWKGLIKDKYFNDFLKRNENKIKWFQNRFTKRHWQGLYLTTIFSLLAIEILYLLNIAFGVIFKNQAVAIDTRIANMVPVVRSEDVTSFAVFVTNLAGWQTIAFAVILIVGYLFYKKYNHLAYALITGVLVEQAISFFLKNSFDRPRPNVSQLVAASDYSFPSGHTMAATVFFGLIAYFIYKGTDKRKNRVTIFGILLAFIVLVAATRLYLGVHFLSDVIAGMLVGLIIITVIIGFLEIDEKYLKKRGIGDLEPRPLIIILSIVLLFNFIPTSQTKILDHKEVRQANSISGEKIDESLFEKVPKFSETLIGSPMEPVGIVYLGSIEQIREGFKKAGWYESELPTVINTFEVYAAGFYDKPAPSATMTPSFLSARTQDISFSEPTDKNSVRQRHHTRIWKTDYKLENGKEVWVSTASFDERIQMRGLIGTHKIDPDIDKERDYIVTELKSSVLDSYLVRVTEPHIGRNSIGDEFFTDGKAIVLDLK